MSDDEEQYEFEYSDAEEEPQADDVTVKAENAYYNAKSAVSSGDEAGARAGFQEVLDLEADSGAAELVDWGFKATKQLVKLCYRTNAFTDMLKHFKSVLERINSGQVTRNRAEKSINRILELVSSGHQSEQLEEFYRVTLDALVGPGNDRLAFKTRTKLARLYLRAGDWKRLRPLLQQLQDSCGADAAGNGGAGAGTPAAESDKSKATALLEVYALQMEMWSALADTKRVGELYRRAMAISRTAVPHPSVTGVIRECGGKMYMRERSWESARVEFLEAFKGYEEAGWSHKTVACLRYLLLANMLSDSRINPFDDQSTKAYERDPAVTAMVSLTDAFLARDIATFEPLLRQHHASLVADEFMARYLSDLLFSIRSQAALQMVAPYSRVSIARLAADLGLPTAADAEYILVGLIQDGALAASIDQPSGVLTLVAGGSAAVEAAAAAAAAAGGSAGAGAGAAAGGAGAGAAAAKKASSASKASPQSVPGVPLDAAQSRYAEISHAARSLSKLIGSLVAPAQ